MIRVAFVIGDYPPEQRRLREETARSYSSAEVEVGILSVPARPFDGLTPTEIQAAAPIFHDKIVERPETIASAIRIGNPASWKQARVAIEESRGAIDIVSDGEIVVAQTWLARHEGIFVEPASAAAIAGLFKCCDSKDARYSFKEIPEGSRIVCTVTGHGLKDPDVIQGQLEALVPVAPITSEVRCALAL